MNIGGLKQDLKKKTDKNPEQYYPISVLTNLGFNRDICSKCSTRFWSTKKRKTCGEPDCNEGYSFINKSPAKSKLGYLQTWDKYAKHFKKLGYTPIKRYPVVARWRDDTWFTQASIYCFQPFVVSGQVKPPANPLVMSQPSLRFNDLDNVGITGRHYSTHFHLGQHAFVPKEQYNQEKYLSDIISWLNKGVKLPLNEIQFHEDQWGGGGNLGTSLEYFSRGMELGNQVYMKYKVTPRGYKNLNINVLDMGSGQERYPWLTSGKALSYELTMPKTVKYLYRQSGRKPNMSVWNKFVPLSGNLNIDEVNDIGKMWGRVARKIGYSKEKLKNEIYPTSSLYAIADHSRTLLFALADGALPSNSGGGYNLRSTFRRSMDLANRYNIKLDYGKLIELHANFLKPQYPELIKSVKSVNEILKSEESKYYQTKETGKKIMQRVLKGKIDTRKLIELYDSHGISPELLAEEGSKLGKKITIPVDFYTQVSERHEKKNSPKFRENEREIPGIEPTVKLFWMDEKSREFEARVLKIINNRYVILDKTLFYATGGGQLNDTGFLNNSNVVNVENRGPHILHEVENINFKVGDLVIGKINDVRRSRTMRHHTGTHVIGGAARKVLGKHVWQGGSEVSQDRGRLDITHYDNITPTQLKRIEKVSNDIIKRRIPIEKEILSKNRAEKKYGFTVYQGGFIPGGEIRVLHVKGFDAQACGGTHLSNTAELKKIRITGSKKIQDGLIRLNYVAGDVANELEHEEKAIGKSVMSAFGSRGIAPIDQVETAAAMLKTQKSHLSKNIAKFRKETIQMKTQMSQSRAKITRDLKFNTTNIPKAVEQLFTLWKKTRKELKKFKKR